MSWATTRPEVTAGSEEITQKKPHLCFSVCDCSYSLLYFPGLARGREEWSLPLGKRTLWTVGRNRNRPHDADPRSFTLTNTAGNRTLYQDAHFVLYLRGFYNIFLFSCVCVLRCPGGLRSELHFPGPVQWDGPSCRRRTVWQTGPGEFWWSLRPHYYLCLPR